MALIHELLHPAGLSLKAHDPRLPVAKPPEIDGHLVASISDQAQVVHRNRRAPVVRHKASCLCLLQVDFTGGEGSGHRGGKEFQGREQEDDEGRDPDPSPSPVVDHARTKLSTGTATATAR